MFIQEEFDPNETNRFTGDLGWITELVERHDGKEKLLGRMTAGRPERSYIFWPKLEIITRYRSWFPHDRQAWALVSHALDLSFE